MSDIAIFKLITGEEVIGVVEATYTDYYKVRDPDRIVSGLEPNRETGKIEIQSMLIDYTPFSEDDFIAIDMKHVLFVTKPTKGIRETYLKAHAEPMDSIKLPKKKIIL